jgi:hypothetical protein
VIVEGRQAAVSAGNERGLSAQSSGARFGGEVGDGGQRGPVADQHRRTGVGKVALAFRRVRRTVVGRGEAGDGGPRKGLVPWGVAVVDGVKGCTAAAVLGTDGQRGVRKRIEHGRGGRRLLGPLALLLVLVLFRAMSQFRAWARR